MFSLDGTPVEKTKINDTTLGVGTMHETDAEQFSVVVPEAFSLFEERKYVAPESLGDIYEKDPFIWLRHRSRVKRYSGN